LKMVLSNSEHQKKHRDKVNDSGLVNKRFNIYPNTFSEIKEFVDRVTEDERIKRGIESVKDRHR